MDDRSLSIKKDHSLKFKDAPKEWKRKSNEKAQSFFTNGKGSVFYANSYCANYYDKPLKGLALEHIQQLGDEIKIENQRERSVRGLKGLYSKIAATYEGRPVFLRHFGFKLDDCYYDLNGISPSREQIELFFDQFLEAMEVKEVKQ
ncbi:MAG: hypothetical protein WD025_05010 [Bacteriovoracaceae bacterium]